MLWVKVKTVIFNLYLESHPVDRIKVSQRSFGRKHFFTIDYKLPMAYYKKIILSDQVTSIQVDIPSLVAWFTLYCCDKHDDPKQLEEKGVCFILQLSGHISSLRKGRERTSCRKLEAGIEAEAMKKCSLLAFSYNTGPLAQG